MFLLGLACCGDGKDVAIFKSAVPYSFPVEKLYSSCQSKFNSVQLN